MRKDVFRHRKKKAATSLAHIGGVAVEQVVSHAEEELLQFLPEKWGGRKLALCRRVFQCLAAPLNGRRRHLTADLQVELLYLLRVVFGRGCFFTEVT